MSDEPVPSDLCASDDHDDTAIVRHGMEIHILGLTGTTALPGDAPNRLAAQCSRALLKGERALEKAGLGFEDVVRVVYLVQDGDAFASCFGLLREAFGKARPVTTLRLVHGFANKDVDIEIDLIAMQR